MNKIITSILFVIISVAALCPVPASAQQILSEIDRNRYINEIREYKHNFLTKELNLSKEQQTEFFPVYDEMEDRILTIGSETRELERSIAADQDIPDVQVEAAAEAIYNQKFKEAQIENEYFPKFKEILTPRQLLILKNSEKKFTQSLVRHHRRMSRDRK